MTRTISWYTGLPGPSQRLGVGLTGCQHWAYLWLEQSTMPFLYADDDSDTVSKYRQRDQELMHHH